MTFTLFINLPISLSHFLSLSLSRQAFLSRGKGFFGSLVGSRRIDEYFEQIKTAPVTGYAVFADGKRVTDVDSPSSKLLRLFHLCK